MALVPASTNWSKDPRGTRIAYWTSIGTKSVDTTRYWVAPSSVKFSIASGSYTANTALVITPAYNGAAPNDAIPVVPGDVVSAIIRLNTDLANKNFRLSARFYTAAGGALGSERYGPYSDPVSNSPSEWTPAIVTGVVAPATAAWVRFSISVGNLGSFVGPANLWWDGFDVRINQELDSFISGAEGPDYMWNGASDASTSKRFAVETQSVPFTGGVVTITPHIYRSSLLNETFDEITGSFSDFTIDVDVDRTIKKTATFSYFDPGVIRAYKDYLAVYIELQEEDKEPYIEQVGLFTVEIPSESGTEFNWQADISCYELTWLLEESAVRDTYIVAGGVKYIDAARSIVASVGLRHLFPDDTRTVPTGGIGWPPGTTKLTILNDILQAISMYNAWTTRDGYVTSMPYRDIKNADIFRTYVIGENSQLVGDPSFDPNDDTIRNVIIVVKDDPSGTPLVAVEVNDSVNSPTSTVNLGRERTRTVSDSTLADQAAVNALAKRLMQELGVSTSATVAAFPDPAMEPHQAVVLDFSNDPVLARHSGRYWMSGYSFGGTVENCSLALKLRRTEDLP